MRLTLTIADSVSRGGERLSGPHHLRHVHLSSARSVRLSYLSMSFISLNASLYLSRCLSFLYRCPPCLFLSLYLYISLYTSLYISLSLHTSLYLSTSLSISLHLSTPLYISIFTGTTCAAAPDGSGSWTCQYTFCLPDNMICDVTRQRL